MAKRVTLSELDKKLNKVIKNQSVLLKGQSKLERLEKQIESEEEEELKRLKSIRKEIEEELGPHPLTKITSRDIAKGVVGSFIGIVAHFTFFYGIKVAHWLTMTRAALLYPLSLVIGGVFMYATGFRKVKGVRVMKFLPVRLLVLYIVSLVVSALVLFFFSPEFLHSFEYAFKELSTVSLIAIIGACTADLIGKE